MEDVRECEEDPGGERSVRGLSGSSGDHLANRKIQSSKGDIYFGGGKEDDA